MFKKTQNPSKAMAVRMAPIAASLTALALVAACARTNPGKAKITEESPDAISQAKVMKALNAAKPNYKVFDPANMTLAKGFMGATLESWDRENGQMHARVSIAMQNSPDLIMSGALNATADSDLADDSGGITIAPSFKVFGRCTDAQCTAVTLTVAELKLAPTQAVPALKPTEIPGLGGTTDDKASQPKSDTLAGAQPQDPKTAPATATSSDLTVATGAELVLNFVLTDAATQEKIATQSNPDIPATEDKWKLDWSTPTVDQQLNSGKTLSFADAKAQAGLPVPPAKAPIAPTAPVAPAAGDAKTPASPEQGQTSVKPAALKTAQVPAAPPVADKVPLEKPAPKIVFTPVKANKAAVVAAAVAAQKSTSAPAMKTVKLSDVPKASAVKTSSTNASVAKKTTPKKSAKKADASAKGAKAKAKPKTAMKKPSAAAGQLPSVPTAAEPG